MLRAKKIAYQIMSSFDKNYRWFLRITRGAPERFEQRLWVESQQATRDRINQYDESVSNIVAELYDAINPNQVSAEFWVEMKLAYSQLLVAHPNSN